jgi:hypothetical protein
MARNFAPFTHLNVLLNFNERANAGLGANPAAIKVYKVRMMNEHPFSQMDIGSYHRQLLAISIRQGRSILRARNACPTRNGVVGPYAGMGLMQNRKATLGR